jgi:RNA polymerase sigma-70 factor (ECF subfamily)
MDVRHAPTVEERSSRATRPGDRRPGSRPERNSRGTDPLPDALSDADLIQRSLGEPGCFAAIFERHADQILRYAHARLGADLAEDVTAETFLAAFRRRAAYDVAYSDARPWLFGIAIRQIGKHRRAERRYREAVARLPAELTAADFGEGAERMTAEQLRPRIAAVLSGRIRVKTRKALGGANPARETEETTHG